MAMWASWHLVVWMLHSASSGFELTVWGHHENQQHFGVRHQWLWGLPKPGDEWAGPLWWGPAWLPWPGSRAMGIAGTATAPDVGHLPEDGWGWAGMQGSWGRLTQQGPWLGRAGLWGARDQPCCSISKACGYLHVPLLLVAISFHFIWHYLNLFYFYFSD